MSRVALSRRAADAGGAVLVTGGYGYIGSHTVVQLLDRGRDVVVVDNLANSNAAVGDRIKRLTGRIPCLRTLDLRDRECLDQVFAQFPIAAVIHFAGLKAVGESVTDPLAYYDNNLGSTISLTQAMRAHDVRTLLFSSSATVYGAATPSPLAEEAPRAATNPYGRTKLVIEDMLADLAASDPRWRIAALRYFNPVGAHPSGELGEDPSGTPANLLPYISQVAIGRRDHLRVFGTDYDTADGTGVRDYIHVQDLAAGHLAALDHLGAHDDAFRVWNLGTGRGTSVLELVHAFEQASGCSIPWTVAARRPGDVATSYADPRRAHIELGWHATHDLHDMCADAWRWQSANPTGYPQRAPAAAG